MSDDRPVSDAHWSWHHGEYMLWLNNTEGSHFGSHAIVGTMLDQDNATIGRAILDAYPARDFSTSIDPTLIDLAMVGRELRTDHADLRYDAK